ncbi:CBO0543 family protein [Ornithinibacillus californiensis]|uniref:CBO0543 family protein n=1 Tax=Ornithinibacillus californiensis TaxID=161536 RepID=UPI00064D858A|nr:CBO0543 family protein [Ornithinibacillus californiensis]
MNIQTAFVFVASFVFILIAYFIPKKVNPHELYTTSIFAALFGLIVDMVLAVKYKFYVLDSAGVQIPPLVGQVVLYFTGCVIILNYYPFHKAIKWKIAYILLCSMLAVIFEFISHQFEFINYNEWKLWYSALCYPFIILFFVLHFKFFRWLESRKL